MGRFKILQIYVGRTRFIHCSVRACAEAFIASSRRFLRAALRSMTCARGKNGRSARRNGRPIAPPAAEAWPAWVCDGVQPRLAAG
jgi:hypothetical protein